MRDPRGVQPLHAAAAYFLMLLLAVLLLMGGPWLGAWLGGWLGALINISAMQWASLLAIAVVLGLAALSFSESLNLRPARLRQWLSALFLGVGFCLFIGATLAHLYSLGDAADYAHEVQQVLGEAQAQLGLLALILVIAVLAPVSEELLFRGLILQGLRARMQTWMAAVLSSLLFAVLHLHPAHFSITFLLGLLCAWTVIRFRSIWPAIILHASYNGSAMMMDVMELPEVLPLWTVIPALAMMGVGTFLASRS